MKLDEFAKKDKTRTGSPPWCSTLPPEVQKQILDGHAAGVSIAIINRWLKTEGYAESTVNKVARWIANQG